MPYFAHKNGVFSQHFLDRTIQRTEIPLAEMEIKTASTDAKIVHHGKDGRVHFSSRQKMKGIKSSFDPTVNLGTYSYWWQLGGKGAIASAILWGMHDYEDADETDPENLIFEQADMYDQFGGTAETEGLYKIAVMIFDGNRPPQYEYEGKRPWVDHPVAAAANAFWTEKGGSYMLRMGPEIKRDPPMHLAVLLFREATENEEGPRVTPGLDSGLAVVTSTGEDGTCLTVQYPPPKHWKGLGTPIDYREPQQAA